MKSKSVWLLALVALMWGVWAGGHNVTESTESHAATSSLDEAEKTHLIFMREEEKLARDVYLTLAEKYPRPTVFYDIATQSEQVHTDSILEKLDQYGVPDPNPDTNNLPDSIGVFTGELFGEYFTEKFNSLVNKGSVSLLEALKVGAFIEELDMQDIAYCPKAVMSELGCGDDTCCGLVHTDEIPIQRVYTNLIEGSKNHLRAFVGQIEAITGEPYVAQYLPQELVDCILADTCIYPDY
jgi:hypothetical protein